MLRPESRTLGSSGKFAFQKQTGADWIGHMRYVARSIQIIAVIIAALLIGLVLAYVVACLGIARQISTASLGALANGCLGLAALAGVAAIWWRVWRWVMIAVGVACGGFVLFLVSDVPTRPSFNAGTIAPENSPSYAAYRRLLKSGSDSRIAERRAAVGEIPRFDGKPDEWPQFVATHRAAFSTAWERDAIGREWIDAMAASAPDGTFPVLSYGTPPLDFLSMREISLVQWAHAQSLASDGDPDAAARVLLNFLRAEYNLQRSGSMLVTQMIAMMGVRGTYERLQPLLTTGHISPETRAAAAAELASAPDPTLIFHQAVIGEKFLVRSWAEMVGVDRQQVFGAGWLFLLLYQPNRTESGFFAVMDEAETLMAARKLDALKQAQERNDLALAAFPWRNPVGIELQRMTMPTLISFAQGTWQADDKRRALQKMLSM